MTNDKDGTWGPMPEETGTADVLATLRDLFDTLGRQQQAVARFLLEHTSEAVFLSAGNLGKRTGTHAATVVRLAQRLGYGGFRDLQAELRAQTITQQTHLLDMADRVVQSGSTDELISLSFHQAARNMKQAIAEIDPSVVDKIVGTLVNSRRVFIIGMGKARPVSTHLASSLRHTGLDVHESGDTLASAQEVALLGPGDAAFSIDYHRYYRETVQLTSTARERGATVCALTDAETSALTPYVDHLLIVPSEAAATPRTSLAGSMVAVEVLLAAITNTVQEQTRTTMQEIDGAYRAMKIFTATRRPNSSH